MALYKLLSFIHPFWLKSV